MILKESKFSFLFFLFTCAWLLPKGGLVPAILLSDKAIHKQGPGSAGLKEVTWKQLMVTPFLYVLCFRVSLSWLCSFSTYLNYNLFLCGKHGIWISFHESIFMNNWETLVFRNHKVPPLLHPVLGSVPQHGLRSRAVVGWRFLSLLWGASRGVVWGPSPWCHGVMSCDWPFLPGRELERENFWGPYSVL